MHKTEREVLWRLRQYGYLKRISTGLTFLFFFLAYRERRIRIRRLGRD